MKMSARKSPIKLEPEWEKSVALALKSVTYCRTGAMHFRETGEDFFSLPSPSTFTSTLSLVHVLGKDWLCLFWKWFCLPCCVSCIYFNKFSFSTGCWNASSADGCDLILVLFIATGLFILHSSAIVLIGALEKWWVDLYAFICHFEPDTFQFLGRTSKDSAFVPLFKGCLQNSPFT